MSHLPGLLTAARSNLIYITHCVVDDDASCKCEAGTAKRHTAHGSVGDGHRRVTAAAACSVSTSEPHLLSKTCREVRVS